MMIYSTYTWDLVRPLESASPASCKSPATFIDSIRPNNKPEKSKESRNEIELPKNCIVLPWPMYAEPRANLLLFPSNTIDFLVPSFNPKRMTQEMKVNTIQLLSVSLLACASMKNATSCDKLCELQNSVNHWIFECKLRCLDIEGPYLSECQVKPSHAGVIREPQTFDDAWLSVYLNSTAIVKVVFVRLN